MRGWIYARSRTRTVFKSARVTFVFNHLLRRRLLRRRLLRRRLLLLLFELAPERSCDELVVVALHRRELRSQAADVGGSRGDRRHCRHCCNPQGSLLDLPVICPLDMG